MRGVATTALLAALLAGAVAHAQDLVVESSMPGTLELEAGDLLLAWTFDGDTAAEVPFSHPLELHSLRQRAIAGQSITLLVDRAGETRSVDMPAAEWDIRTAFRVEIGPETIEERLGSLQSPAIRAAYLEALARRSLSAWQAEDATTAWSRALQIREAIPGDDLESAAALQGLGDAALIQRDLEQAARYLQQALEIRQRLAPGSLATALSRQRLAFVALERRDLPAAERHIDAALAVSSRTPPHGVIHAETLRGLGIIHAIKGDAEAARRTWLEALGIYRAWAPGSVDESRVLSNVGIAVWQIGDLVAAERYFRQALEIVEELAPGSQPHAGYLNNLGLIYHRRFEFDRARIVYERATGIFESRAPDSLEVARSLTNVALAYGLGGEAEQALERLDRVLEIQLRLQPDSTDVAQTYHAIGLNHDRSGDLEAAEASFRTALEMRVELLPASQAVAVTAQNLGMVLAKLGRDVDAEHYHRRALSLFSRLAPGTTQEAQAQHALGEIHRDRGETAEALEHFRAAVIAIERQTSRLGGSEEARGNFSARFASFYKDYIELLLQQGSEEQAFHFLERYRARMLREMLAERRLSLDDELPERLRERRRDVSQQYERAIGQLRRLSDTDANAAQIDSILEQLNALQVEREAIAASVRETAPRLAAIDTRSVEPAATAGALEGDSVLLSYCVTPTATYLFVISDRHPARIVTIPAGRDRLEQDIESYRLLLQVPDGGPDVFAGLSRKGHSLYELLLASALGDIEPDTRLIIIPDGPLHTLPFASLVTELQDGDPQSPRYLIERHPMHTVLSATLYVSDRAGAGSSTGGAEESLAAFGDPVFETAISRPGDVRSRALQPLPSSRAEVESIAGMFAGDTQTFLGADATEEAVKAVAPESRYLHIATHGVLDSRFPLDSYLAFTTPSDPDTAPENGLLYAWEVLEQVRLDADLVVMSACETGLGREAGGEGLLGLSWAFQYAGARSVVASLWPVPDESTAVLMSSLYGSIEDGMARDQALRQAQLELIEAAGPEGVWDTIVGWLGSNDGEASIAHPYYWGAFQLAGIAD